MNVWSRTVRTLRSVLIPLAATRSLVLPGGVGMRFRHGFIMGGIAFQGRSCPMLAACRSTTERWPGLVQCARIKT